MIVMYLSEKFKITPLFHIHIIFKFNKTKTNKISQKIRFMNRFT